MYPKIIINTEKYRHNVRYLIDKSHKTGISVMGVSKVFCADQKLINILNEENIDYIADSRIQNLESIITNIPKVLLRLPSYSEAENIILNSDISLNSEISTIKQLNKFSKIHNTIHGVILMIDLGDLREGLFTDDDIFDTVKSVLKLKNISLKGIGTNLTCFGGVIPTIKVLSKLVDYKTRIENEFNISLEIISGGNSSNIKLLLEDSIPFGINNLRLGEAIILGRETAYGSFIDNTYSDIFTLEAEIIELKEKPSKPIGEIGMNAFGKVPIFKDKGNMLRAILSIGKQDVDHKELIPIDNVEILGSSSDHIIVDVSNSLKIYGVGDIIKFKLTYASVLSLMTSKYVGKYYE
jgi:predicted amino acid racemase